MLLRKDNRAAGELEGGKARLELDYSHQKRPKDFLTSTARFFVKRRLHKKCGVFTVCKKVTDFFDTLC